MISVTSTSKTDLQAFISCPTSAWLIRKQAQLCSMWGFCMQSCANYGVLPFRAQTQQILGNYRKLRDLWGHLYILQILCFCTFVLITCGVWIPTIYDSFATVCSAPFGEVPDKLPWGNRICRFQWSRNCISCARAINYAGFRSMNIGDFWIIHLFLFFPC